MMMAGLTGVDDLPDDAPHLRGSLRRRPDSGVILEALERACVLGRWFVSGAVAQIAGKLRFLGNNIHAKAALSLRPRRHERPDIHKRR